jgi:hypothetical protein
MHNVATSSRGPSESSLRVATHLAGVRRPDLAGGGTSKLVHLALHVTTCLAVARRKDEGMGMCMAAAHREYNLRRGSFLPNGDSPVSTRIGPREDAVSCRSNDFFGFPSFLH